MCDCIAQRITLHLFCFLLGFIPHMISSDYLFCLLKWFFTCSYISRYKIVPICPAFPNGLHMQGRKKCITYHEGVYWQVLELLWSEDRLWNWVHNTVGKCRDLGIVEKKRGNPALWLAVSNRFIYFISHRLLKSLWADSRFYGTCVFMLPLWLLSLSVHHT